MIHAFFNSDGSSNIIRNSIFEYYPESVETWQVEQRVIINFLAYLMIFQSWHTIHFEKSSNIPKNLANNEAERSCSTCLYHHISP